MPVVPQHRDVDVLFLPSGDGPFGDGQGDSGVREGQPPPSCTDRRPSDAVAVQTSHWNAF